MNFWRKVLFGLKVAEQVAVKAGDAGITIKGRNPSEVDAAARAGATAIISALKKKPGPVPVPPSSTGE